jgi:histidinol dehydrogenase
MLPIIDARIAQGEADVHTLLKRRQHHSAADVSGVVRDIIAEVKTHQDAALLTHIQRFDRVSLSDASRLRLNAEEIAESAAHCPSNVREALAYAIARIRDYHQHQLPKGFSFTDAFGNQLGMRWNAVDAAGIYVPGGKASYPSSVLMNAIPAQAAGVARIAMCVPTPDGALNPTVMAAAQMVGITEIYRLSGASAIAALAYGTETIPAVNVIAGPGNAYVAEAKRQVFGVVGIDMVAGPSEIAVIADGTVPAAWIAADLLSQAEHDELAQSILLTAHEAYAEEVRVALMQHMAQLSRRSIMEASLRDYSAIVLVRDLDHACQLSDIIAPEHLELAVASPQELLPRLRHAGAIFSGAYTPEAIGDYVAGSSHVLPTMQTASYASGLSVYHFMKKTSLIECSREGFHALRAATATLAQAEGLDAHALSVTIRGE